MNNPVVGLCQLFNSQMQDINWTKRQRTKQQDKNNFFFSAKIFGDHTDGVCIYDLNHKCKILIEQKGKRSQMFYFQCTNLWGSHRCHCSPGYK